jgi:hypothetical protein
MSINAISGAASSPLFVFGDGEGTPPEATSVATPQGESWTGKGPPPAANPNVTALGDGQGTPPAASPTGTEWT